MDTAPGQVLAAIALAFRLHRTGAMLADPLAKKVIGCAIEVHRHLGPGLFESVYQRCLAHELALQGVAFAAECAVPLVYKGMPLNCGFRVDFVVEGRLVLEVKTCDRLLPVHHAQVITYLRLLALEQALLLNFHVPRLIDGLRSVVLTSRPAGPANREDMKA